MTFTFKIGKKYGSPPYWLRWWAILFNPKRIKRLLVFTNNSRYILPDNEQQDLNKIIGLKYGLSKTCASARFTYWFNPKTDKFEIFWYVRDKGQRDADFDFLYAADPYEELSLSLFPRDGAYTFQIYGSKGLLAYKTISKNHNHKFAFLSGPYFGGNMKSPYSNSFKLSKP